MKARQILLTLALASFLVTAGCLGTAQSTAPVAAAPAPAVQVSNETTANDTAATQISVAGRGEVSAEADLAEIRISVTSLADTADAARQDVAARVNNVTAALVEAGVPEDAIQTTSFSITPEYDYSGESRELVGYRAVHAFSIEVAPDMAGQVIDVSVASGADTVNSVTFTLSDETRTELRRQALARAVNDARSDADAVAGAANLTITGVERIDVGQTVVPFEATVREAGVGDETTLRPGPVTVSADVSVTYRAESAE